LRLRRCYSLSLRSGSSSWQLTDTGREYLDIIPATKDLQPPFNRCRKHNSNRRPRRSLPRPYFGPIHLLETGCHRRHDRCLDSPLLLLSRHRSLGGRKTSWHSLRVLPCRRDRQSHRLSPRPALAVRASAVLWSADRKDLDAESCSHPESNYVVGGGDVFRSGSNPECALCMERTSSGKQVVSDFRGVVGHRSAL
jgi:hypothetical protein